MLRVLRERKASWILRILLILVAVTFISWGGSYLLRERKQTYAAKVNRVVIEWKDYNDAFQGVVKQYRDALGPSFSDKLIEQLHLKNRVLDDLISKILLLQEGTRLGITIHDEELREAIQSIPAFQFNGRFDQRNYERFLRLNRMSAEEFERMHRENLLLSRVVSLIKLNSAKVSEEEILETYLFENERLNLNFLKVTPEAFRGVVNVNEIEIKDYFQKHQEEFRIPASIRIQYLLFRPSDFEGKVQVSSEEVKRFYDQQKDRWMTPKRVRAKEILIKVGPEDPPNKVEEKKKRAEDILEKAKKTKDFGSLAKQYSESSTASKGGDIGWVEKGTLDEPFETTLFSMKAGDLSGLVRARDGFHIFKIDEVSEGKQKSFDEVKDQILQALKKEKGRKEASRRADEAFYSLFRSRDLEKFSRENDLPIRTTGFFKEGDEIPEIGKNPFFYSNAFSLKVGEISTVVSIPPNFYILKLIDKKEFRIPPLDEVKNEVRQKAIGLKTEEKARQVSEDLLNQIRSGKEIKEVAKEKGYSLEETGFFTRTSEAVPKIGPAGEFMAVLSSLTEKNPIPKEVLRTKEGFFVVKLIASEPADENKFPSVKKNLENRLIHQKQEEYFQNWLNQLRSKAKIDINKELL